MKKFAIIITCLYATLAYSQSEKSSGGIGHGSNSVSGTITTFSIQSINVEKLNVSPIEFKDATDYNRGKNYPNYFKVTVISTTPWMVSVKAMSSNFNKHHSSSEMPVSLINMTAKNSYGTFGPVGLSATPQTFLTSLNNEIRNVFFVDMSLNPGWNYSGGNYSTTLLFTLTPQ